MNNIDRFLAPHCEVGVVVLGSTTGVGKGEVRLGNNVFLEHNSKDMVVTYQVSEDETTRICDQKSLLWGNVEWRKPVGGFNSAL